jgi:hypothetical protein
MKIILTENQSTELLSNLIKKLNIKFDIFYWNDNGRDSITGTVYLYKDGEILGYRHGYEFYFKYDSRFNSLTPDGHFPNIENVDIFKFMPPQMVIKFFSDKVETNLKNYIDKGYSGLRRE